MRLALVLIMLLCWSVLGHANAVQQTIASKAKPQAKLQLDISKIVSRKFNSQEVHRYSQQKAFIYDDVVPQTESVFARFWRWFWKQILTMFGNNGTMNVLKFILIAIVIGLVTFIVIKVLGLDLKLITGKSKPIEIPYEEDLENIHEINFDEQLALALQANNYRLAVRLLYLKTLKQLNDAQLIDWQPQKTNQAYVNELADANKKQAFAKLTYQFEYIWYGAFYINQTSFEPIEQSFKQFNQTNR